MPSDSAVGKHKETEALVEAAHKLETLEGGCILSDSDLGEEENAHKSSLCPAQ